MSAGDPRAPRRPQWIAGEKECRDLAAADSAEERTGLGAARGHLLDDYGTALVACSDPDDALACHYAATHPKRHAGEELSDAVDRADLAFRAAAAHCQPAAAGRFWAIYGLLTPSKRSTYTGRPGICGQLQRSLRETTEAAAARYQALLADLLSWAKVQSTTAVTNPPPASSSDWRPAIPSPNPCFRSRTSAALFGRPFFITRSSGFWSKKGAPSLQERLC